MRHPNLARVEGTALVVIDVQEKLLAAMQRREAVADNVGRLVRLARILALPVVLTEQYARGLGTTVPAVRDAMVEFQPLEKNAFSCFLVEPFVSRLEQLGVKTVLLAGIEAHVCVSQTALDGIARGYQAHVLADCISSRTDENYRLGIQKMRAAGAVISSLEIAIYEMLERSSTPAFKEAQPLLK